LGKGGWGEVLQAIKEVNFQKTHLFVPDQGTQKAQLFFQGRGCTRHSKGKKVSIGGGSALTKDERSRLNYLRMKNKGGAPTTRYLANQKIGKKASLLKGGATTTKKRQTTTLKVQDHQGGDSSKAKMKTKRPTLGGPQRIKHPQTARGEMNHKTSDL